MYDLESYNIAQEISFTKEESNLLSALPAKVKDILKRSDAFIAGGAITSIFSCNEVKDYDVFFRGEESLNLAVEAMAAFRSTRSENAITYFIIPYKDAPKKLAIQFIVLEKSFKQNPTDIFADFDFTVCCGLYDFKRRLFALHHNFLKHLAQRVLVYNSKCSYPINALMRSQKYLKKGYTIDNLNLLKIAVDIMHLDVKTNQEFVKHIQGMYEGVSKLVLMKQSLNEGPLDVASIVSKLENIQNVRNPYIEEMPDNLPF